MIYLYAWGVRPVIYWLLDRLLVHDFLGRWAWYRRMVGGVWVFERCGGCEGMWLRAAGTMLPPARTVRR